MLNVGLRRKAVASLTLTDPDILEPEFHNPVNEDYIQLKEY